MSSVLFNQSWLKFDGYHMRLEEDKQGTLFCLFFWLQARQNDTSEAKTHANFRILKWVICITRLNMCASWVTLTNKFVQLYYPIGLTCVLKSKMFNNLLSLSLSLTHEHTHAHTSHCKIIGAWSEPESEWGPWLCETVWSGPSVSLPVRNSHNAVMTVQQRWRKQCNLPSPARTLYTATMLGCFPGFIPIDVLL